MMTETAKVKLRKGRPTKVAAMCYALAMRGAMRKVDILRSAHFLAGRAGGFEPTSNGDYFLPGTRFDGWKSPVASGLIVKVGRDRKGIIYHLSPEGVQLAMSYERWGS